MSILRSTSVAAAFYQPPSPLPEAPAGTLIRSEPAGDFAGLQAWRILYHSRDNSGHDIAVSGVVAAPATPAPAGGRPVVSYGHATLGTADSCTPSAGPSPIIAVIDAGQLFGAGYDVVSTDYPGLGTPGVSPLYVAADEGRAVLDATRAARQIPAAHASAETVLFGYSQGGQAVLAAGKLAGTYAPDLHVHGIAAIAPLVNVPAALKNLTTTAGVGYELLGVIGYAASDPKADLSTILTLTGQTLAGKALTSCATNVLSAATGFTLDQVFTSDPLTTEPWKSGFAAQAADAEGPNMPPIGIAQGTADVTIPRTQTDGTVARLCALGNSVEYGVFPGSDHGTVVGASANAVATFIADRFADRPPTSSCPG